MKKTLGALCLTLCFWAGGMVCGQNSSSEQKPPQLQGHPNERGAHAKAPSDAQVIAECALRKQADHAGMSKAEAEASCRQNPALKGAQQSKGNAPRQ